MCQTLPTALRNFFEQHPRAALAFSGGADSAYLLYAARECGCQLKAYLVYTPFQPAFEVEDAVRLARELGVELQILKLDILRQKEIQKNPTDRCYHCKKALFTHLCEAARKDGYDLILDGTNASDDVNDRPGMRALMELGVVSPLRLCKVTKDALRQFSKQAGLFTWNKPAYACLATRIPEGVPITAQALQNIEQTEGKIHALGFSDFRVRMTRDGGARLQIHASQWTKAASMREELCDALAGFSWDCLDFKTR